MNNIAMILLLDYLFYVYNYYNSRTFQSKAVERSVWEQLIGLYPCLVECTVATASNQVSRSLREALMQYHDLLRPPSNINPPTSNGV